MPHAGQFDLPIDVRRRQIRRDRLRVADARAIRPAESRPFLRARVPSETGQRHHSQEEGEGRFHPLILADIERSINPVSEPTRPRRRRVEGGAIPIKLRPICLPA